METKKPYKAAIFDLDGTLLNSLSDLSRSVNYALSQSSLPPRSEDEVRSFLGNGMTTLMKLSLPKGAEEAVSNRAIELFKKHYSEHCMDSTSPYRGITEALDILKQRGVKIAIVSNKPDFAVRKIAQRFFSKWTTLSVGESEEVRRKPNPDAILAAIRQMETTKESSVYIGDSEVDLQAARNAGLDCISVVWGFRKPSFLIRSGATTLCHTPHEMAEEILGLHREW